MLLDTFADRRNGFVFSTNSQGAKADTQVANEGRDVNPNWDAVWWVEARKTADGWTAEFRIPFKTLRFEAGDGKSWGINFARRVRRKNELSYWSPVSRAYSIFRASSGGHARRTCRALRQGRNLRIKPFLAAGAVRGVGEARIRSRCHRRRRPQGRHHAVADLRCHDQSRLRAGRSRRAASQPHAVQPVLSRRSASSSSRTPASSTSATFPAIRDRWRGSVRPKKICCSSSAGASD